MANKSNKILVTGLYPKVAKSLDKGTLKFKRLVGKFIEERQIFLYDIAPYSRITFSLEDGKKLFDTLDISEQEVLNALSKTYYYDIPKFNPIAAKDPFTVLMIMVIRYFILKKKHTELKLANIYLSFSGKFYPSIHFSSFPKVQPIEHKSVMEYAVNHKLNQQFDLKKEGTVIKALEVRADTWINTYDKRFKECDDEDVVYVIQQLHDRIKSFMQNIAEVYYDVYEDKDSYLNYESDSLGEEDYRIADNDMYKIERAVENTMNAINGVNADFLACKTATMKNDYVKAEELKNIVELVLQDNDNIPLIKELIGLLITIYFNNSKTKDLHNIAFISFSISLKPNTKDKNVLRQKEIVEKLLNENSPAYRRRKRRPATKTAYHRAILIYFSLVAYNANK